MLAREWNRRTRDAVDPAGVHIPFTAPLLSGVCVRANRNALDFLLPNPSGGRGTYVVGWSAVAEYASPTLHDTVLAGQLSGLASLNPVSVRATAQGVALQGYAGRLAADAASRGRSRVETGRVRLWSRLLMALIDATGLAAAERTLLLQGLGQAGPGVMTAGLGALAKRLGWEPATLFDALNRLTASYLPLVRNGRVAVLLDGFDRLRTDLAHALGQLQTDREPDAGGNGAESDPNRNGLLPLPLRRVLPDLDHCLRHGRVVASSAMEALEQPAALLQCWRVDPALPLERIDHVERVLDGWDRIALLWQDCASPSARTAVMPEIALLLRLAAERIRGDDPACAGSNDPARERDPDARPAQDPAREPAVAQGAARNKPPGAEQARGSDASGPPPTAAAITAATTTATIGPARLERNERIRALELDLDGCNG